MKFASTLVLSTLVASTLASHAVHADLPLERRGLHHRAANALKKPRAAAIPGVYMLSIDDKTPTVSDNSATSLVADTTETSADSEVYSSTAIWYPSDGQEGACGVKYTDDDYIVGLSTALWRHPGRVSSLCGQKVQVTMRGRSVVALVGDASGNNYTTLSKAAYGQLQNLTTGMIDITFVFLPKNSRLQTPTIQTTTAAPTQTPDTASGSARSSAANALYSSRSALAASMASAADAEASKASAQGASVTAAARASASAASASAAAASESAASASASASAAAAKASAKAKAKAKAAAAAAEAEAEEEAEAEAKAKADAKANADAKAKAVAQDKADAAAKAKADAKKDNDDDGDDEGDDSGSSSGGGSGQVHKGGFATFYSQNGVAGNCGTVAKDSDRVIALPTAMYAGGSHCGQKIVVTRVSNGAQTTATVRDSCPTCVNNQCLDLSVKAFTDIATEEEGMVAITWQWA
ncbi:BQ2448_1683 [Microbotryum intermedium]|uniref:BQ2448_1683 protein n=1 Tax=Microbotryum intermedium TaxID=269621 RepID=A0A238FBX4_9BASI|nr:BQ2448_1683 [Microbotryum intermedium]